MWALCPGHTGHLGWQWRVQKQQSLNKWEGMIPIFHACQRHIGQEGPILNPDGIYSLRIHWVCIFERNTSFPYIVYMVLFKWMCCHWNVLSFVCFEMIYCMYLSVWELQKWESYPRSVEIEGSTPNNFNGFGLRPRCSQGPRWIRLKKNSNVNILSF